MFGQRHQLDMGETEADGVIDQLFGRLPVGDVPPAVLAPPRAQMHLVDRDRRIAGILRTPPCHPGGVVPAIAGDVANDRCRARRMLGAEADRIGLQRARQAVRAEKLVFVGRAVADAGQEYLPHAGRTAPPHRMAPAVPAVEIPHDRDPLRVRRPDREMGAIHALMPHHMGAKCRPQPPMRALADQVFVDLAQHRAEPIGIVMVERNAVGRLACQPIGAIAWHGAPKQARMPRHCGQPKGVAASPCGQGRRPWIKGGDIP
jgi:hypothetical protein